MGDRVRLVFESDDDTLKDLGKKESIDRLFEDIPQGVLIAAGDLCDLCNIFRQDADNGFGVASIRNALGVPPNVKLGHRMLFEGGWDGDRGVYVIENGPDPDGDAAAGEREARTVARKLDDMGVPYGLSDDGVISIPAERVMSGTALAVAVLGEEHYGFRFVKPDRAQD